MNIKKILQALSVGFLSLTMVFSTQINAEYTSSDISSNQELFKKEALKLGQAACFLTTHGEDPYVKVLRPDIDEAKILKCGCFDAETGKIRHTKEAKDLENFTVLSLTLNGFGGNYKISKKYKGERKSLLGIALEKVVEDTYPGKVLVDEYKLNIPMFWFFQNEQEFTALRTYMEKNLRNETNLPSIKTLLVLKIDTLPDLEKLEQVNKEFIAKYFNIFPLTDNDVKTFFAASKDILLDHGSALTNPKYVGETALQGVIRETEKYYKDFKGRDIAIIVGVFVTVSLFKSLLDNEIRSVNDCQKECWGKIFGKKGFGPKPADDVASLFDGMRKLGNEAYKKVTS